MCFRKERNKFFKELKLWVKYFWNTQFSKVSGKNSFLDGRLDNKPFPTQFWDFADIS